MITGYSSSAGNQDMRTYHCLEGTIAVGSYPPARGPDTSDCRQSARRGSNSIILGWALVVPALGLTGAKEYASTAKNSSWIPRMLAGCVAADSGMRSILFACVLGPYSIENIPQEKDGDQQHRGNAEIDDQARQIQIRGEPRVIARGNSQIG